MNAAAAQTALGRDRLAAAETIGRGGGSVAFRPMAGLVHTAEVGARRRADSRLTAAALALGPAPDQAPAAAGDDPGPNIVVVMSDDQGPGMIKALPTVGRELGARGVVFENAFATFPLCCPARATLLTGQYAHNHGTLGNNPLSGGGYQSLIDPDRNLAAWLQADGYDTAFAGKWLNGLRTPRKPPPGWDSWSGLVGEGGDGLSSFYDFDVFEADGTPRHYGNATADYQTDALTRDYALPYIGAQAVEPGPFFLWLAYHPPHSGIGRDDAAGRRCSDGPPADRASQQSAIPPPRYARALPARPGPAVALLRRARRLRQAEAGQPPAAALRSRPRDDRRATTAAGWRRCGRSTTASARSSPSSAPPDSSRTR